MPDKIDFNAKIKVGDIFVRHYGNNEQVLLMLPSRPKSAKQWYRRLHIPGVSIDSAWWERRNGIGGHARGPKWHYVGTVPAEFIEELMK